jgi:hypothetical protein
VCVLALLEKLDRIVRIIALRKGRLNAKQNRQHAERVNYFSF